MMTTLAPSLARFLTIKDVAERLGLSTKTVRRLIERGELRVHRFGRSIRISEEDYNTFAKYRG
jgi:excisionase family DNA binding protein